MESALRLLTIDTQWYDDNKNMLVTEVHEGWTWDDSKLNARLVYDLAMSVDYPVGLVVLLPRTMSIPPTGFVQNSREIIANHTELGFHTIVYVTRVPYTITLWQEMIDAMAPHPSRYFIAASADEALDIVLSRAQ